MDICKLESERTQPILESLKGDSKNHLGWTGMELEFLKGL